MANLEGTFCESMNWKELQKGLGVETAGVMTSDCCLARPPVAQAQIICSLKISISKLQYISMSIKVSKFEVT